jgi:hypothetical protein
MLATLDCRSFTIESTIAPHSPQPLQEAMLRLVIVVSRFVATNPDGALESLKRLDVALIGQELDQIRSNQRKLNQWSARIITRKLYPH